ncbi:Nn.00g114650.m01.CDS01 [Neocucurbitaria sp. VM-36]
MSKRAFESAFSSSMSGGLLVTANGFGASQPQVQQQSPLSSTSGLYVPGQWPLEPSLPIERDDHPTTATASSFFTTIGRWAATVTNVTNLFRLPVRLAERYLRKQTIRAIPVTREDGSNKKRLVDAGFADELSTPSPSARARANLTRRRFHAATTFSPDIWSPSPSPLQPPENLEVASAATDDFYDDESLDFSFTDILTSTPPCNLKTGSPAPLSWDNPSIWERSGSPSPSPSSRRLEVFTGLHSVHESPGHGVSEQPPVTPLRRHLLKLQLRAHAERQEAQEESITEAEAQTLEPETAVYEDSDLPIPSSSPFQSDVASSPSQSHVASNAPPEYENDLSFLSDAASPPPKKSVRWAQHAIARPFFLDEKVSEMLDSTLETITSSPVRPSWQAYDEDQETSDDESQNASLRSETSDEGYCDDQKDISNESRGFHSVPDDTFDCSKDSIDESQISLELLEDLQEDLRKKLALEPTPAPPQPVKPLVLPLSSEELDALDTVVAQTDNGRNSNMYVIPEKLYARDFGTLLPERFNGDPKAWLNDNIVNEYLTILVAQRKKELGFEHKRGGPAPPIHAFSSFWYSTVTKRPQSVERWASRFQLGGSQYLDADLVLYPICDGGHWRLLAVKPKDRVIEYLDSLGFSGQKYIAKLKEYLEKELGEAWVEEDWTTIELQRSSQQLNGSDCGVFTLLNALTLIRGEEARRVVACCGMADARERIATTLLAGHPTTELE